jgi:hypothetical protein
MNIAVIDNGMSYEDWEILLVRATSEFISWLSCVYMPWQASAKEDAEHKSCVITGDIRLIAFGPLQFTEDNDPLELQEFIKGGYLNKTMYSRERPDLTCKIAAPEYDGEM